MRPRVSPAALIAVLLAALLLCGGTMRPGPRPPNNPPVATWTPGYATVAVLLPAPVSMQAALPLLLR